VTSSDQIKAGLNLLVTHVLNKISRAYFQGNHKIQISSAMGSNRIQSRHKYSGLTCLMRERQLRSNHQTSEAV
jgi:hypothetical protein